jgi:hypothetical protein
MLDKSGDKQWILNSEIKTASQISYFNPVNAVSSTLV